jgi:hypothetical protein
MTDTKYEYVTWWLSVGVIGKLPQWEDTSPLNTIFGFGILKGISGDESLLVVAQVLVKVLPRSHRLRPA